MKRPISGVTTALTAAFLLVALTVPAVAADGPATAAFEALQKAWVSGALDEAVSQADKVLALEPQNPGYMPLVGRVYCAKAERSNIFSKKSWADKCRSTWERGVTLDPKNIDLRFMLIEFYVAAPAIAGGGTDKADAQADQIGKLDPVRGEIARGNISKSGMQLAEAETHYRKAMDLDPSGIRGSLALAGFLAGQKRWGDARAIFEARLTRNAGDQFAVFELARLRQAQGVEFPEALALFDRFLAGTPVPDGPSHTDAWFRKGQLLATMGRKAEAITAFESALKLTPNHGPSQAELKRIKG